MFIYIYIYIYMYIYTYYIQIYCIYVYINVGSKFQFFFVGFTTFKLDFIHSNMGKLRLITNKILFFLNFSKIKKTKSFYQSKKQKTQQPPKVTEALIKTKQKNCIISPRELLLKLLGKIFHVRGRHPLQELETQMKMILLLLSSKCVELQINIIEKGSFKNDEGIEYLKI